MFEAKDVDIDLVKGHEAVLAKNAQYPFCSGSVCWVEAREFAVHSILFNDFINDFIYCVQAKKNLLSEMRLMVSPTKFGDALLRTRGGVNGSPGRTWQGRECAKRFEGEMLGGRAGLVTVLRVDEGNKSQPSRKEPIADGHTAMINDHPRLDSCSWSSDLFSGPLVLWDIAKAR